MNLHDDLADRLWRLEKAWNAVHGISVAGAPDVQAAALADGLRGVGPADPGKASILVAEHLVNEHEARTTAFWRSELGRALARWEKAPVDPDTEQVSPSIVAAIMGVSRQRAFELQKSGRWCTPMQIAVALREREAAA
jgi:hypothetical protein